MGKLTEEKRQELRQRLEAAETAMAGMTGKQKREYLVAVGAAEEMSAADTVARFGHARLIFYGEAEPQLQRGDKVLVQTADGAWQDGLRALGSVEEGEGGKVVYVCREEEWQEATQEGRSPGGALWPAASVALVEED